MKRHFYGVLCKGKKKTKEGSDPVQMQRIARARKIENQILQKQGNVARNATRNDDFDDASMDHDDDDFSSDYGDSDIENDDHTNNFQNTKRPRVLREDTDIDSAEYLQVFYLMLRRHRLRHEMAMQNMRHYSFTNRIFMTILMMYSFSMTNSAENGIDILPSDYFKMSSTSLSDISDDDVNDISSLGGSEISSISSRSPCKKRLTFEKEENFVTAEKLLKHFD